MAIAHVNFDSYQDTAGGTTIATPGISHTSANLLVVLVKADSGTVSGIADTASNTYTYVNSIFSAAKAILGELWYAKNITGNASNVVTATFSGTVYDRGIHVLQFSGCDTTAPYDSVTNTTEGAVYVGQTTGAITNNTADAVLVSGFPNAANHTYTSGDGNWVVTGTDATKMGSAYWIVSTAASRAGDMDVNATGSNLYVGIIAAFKIAGGGGGTAVPVFVHQLKQQGIA